MANDYITRAKNFIKQIYPMILADKNQGKYDYLEELMEGVELFNYQYHRKVIFNHGLTRVAFITSDYVVKFDYDDNQADIWGGCEDELGIYEQAEKDGFGYLFAKTTPYEYGQIRFYIMPRIKGIEKHFDDAWEFMTEEEEDWCLRHRLYDLHNQNYGWVKGRICIFDYAAHD